MNLNPRTDAGVTHDFNVTASFKPVDLTPPKIPQGTVTKRKYRS